MRLTRLADQPGDVMGRRLGGRAGGEGAPAGGRTGRPGASVAPPVRAPETLPHT